MHSIVQLAIVLKSWPFLSMIEAPPKPLGYNQAYLAQTLPGEIVN